MAFTEGEDSQPKIYHINSVNKSECKKNVNVSLEQKANTAIGGNRDKQMYDSRHHNKFPSEIFYNNVRKVKKLMTEMWLTLFSSGKSSQILLLSLLLRLLDFFWADIVSASIWNLDCFLFFSIKKR